MEPSPTTTSINATPHSRVCRLPFLIVCCVTTVVMGAEPGPLPQEPNTWVKRSPLANAPPSPGLSYETSLGYDPLARRVIRWGGHAQGGVKGSGEQIAETWTLVPATMTWEHHQPNRSPPPVCCAQQNVFDADQNRFLRFKSFSGNHDWQSQPFEKRGARFQRARFLREMSTMKSCSTIFFDRLIRQSSPVIDRSVPSSHPPTGNESAPTAL